MFLNCRICKLLDIKALSRSIAFTACDCPCNLISLVISSRNALVHALPHQNSLSQKLRKPREVTNPELPTTTMEAKPTVPQPEKRSADEITGEDDNAAKKVKTVDARDPQHGVAPVKAEYEYLPR